MPELIINEADLLDLARQRRSLLTGGIDDKRPQAWEQYGYPNTVGPEQMLQAFQRIGEAAGAVRAVHERCWEEWPRVKLKASDAETPWETKLEALFDKVDAWSKIQEWDLRNMVGRFAGLVLRLGDGRPLTEPVVARRGMRLVDMVPLYEHQLRVLNWDSNPESETFGQPLMWQYRMRSLPENGNTFGQPEKWADVHPDRILILAEGAVGDDFLGGVPFLLSSYNALVDVEKVRGGSAESYLKNSARNIKFILDKDADTAKIAGTKADGTPASASDLGDSVRERIQRLNTSIDAGIVGQGADVGVLETTQHDPEPAYRVAVSGVSAGTGVPSTMLVGQQEGRLASDEDKDALNRRCKARQVKVLTAAVRGVVRRLQAFMVLEPSDFEVEWAPLDAPGDTEKLDNASKMAAINKADTEAGGGGVFDENEIRKAAGYEEKAGLDELPGEGLDDPAADPGQDPPAQPPAPRAVRAANEASLILRIARRLRLAA